MSQLKNLIFMIAFVLFILFTGSFINTGRCEIGEGAYFKSNKYLYTAYLYIGALQQKPNCINEMAINQKAGNLPFSSEEIAIQNFKWAANLGHAIAALNYATSINRNSPDYKKYIYLWYKNAESGERRIALDWIFSDLNANVSIGMDPKSVFLYKRKAGIEVDASDIFYALATAYQYLHGIEYTKN